jgi:hypothetical protein
MTYLINEFGLTTNNLSYPSIANLNINYLLTAQITKDNFKRKIFSSYLLREINSVVYDMKDTLERKNDYLSTYSEFKEVEITNKNNFSISIKNQKPIKSIKAKFVDVADLKEKELFSQVGNYGQELELNPFSWKNSDVVLFLERWKWYFQNTVIFKVEIPTDRNIDFLTFLNIRNEVTGIPTKIIDKPLNGVMEIHGLGVWN